MCVCYLCSTNRQAEMNQKTTPSHINISLLLSHLLYFKGSTLVRDRHRLNTHHITVLLFCYLHFRFISPEFTYSGISRMTGCYGGERVKRYFVLLVGSNMITQARIQGSYIFYTFTSYGLDVITEIAERTENRMYEFCNRYKVEL